MLIELAFGIHIQIIVVGNRLSFGFLHPLTKLRISHFLDFQQYLFKWFTLGQKIVDT